jgi:hypothetical protein
MNRLSKILLTVFLLAFGNLGLADVKTDSTANNKSSICEPNKSSNQFARRGCCSHHGGVCGCSGGRAACCDGTLSPSCGCNSDSIKYELNPTKTRS